ncbi:MAG: proton-conducting transporter membrane subunit, partial [Firmicutes bacterium]|nr:proton-conducting transporter membrane subunit [Bacillota bacterium]
PTPISCYLHSATMVKAGIYLIARMTPILGGTALWGGIITVVGLTSLTFGSLMAIRQFDMKGILAYSTISQLGLIISLFGFGTEAAIAAGLFHLLNHSAFKGSLFLMTGIVDHQAGTRDVRLLKGLAKVMPVTALVACIGSFSMAGLPPFSGFLSKELFLEAASQAHTSNLAFMGDLAYLIPFVAVVASIFTFVYSVALFFKIFIGKQVTTTSPV